MMPSKAQDAKRLAVKKNQERQRTKRIRVGRGRDCANLRSTAVAPRRVENTECTDIIVGYIVPRAPNVWCRVVALHTLAVKVRCFEVWVLVVG